MMMGPAPMIMMDLRSVRFGMGPPRAQIPLGYRRLPGRRKA